MVHKYFNHFVSIYSSGVLYISTQKAIVKYRPKLEKCHFSPNGSRTELTQQ